MTDLLKFRLKLGGYLGLVLVTGSCSFGNFGTVKNSNSGSALGTSYAITYLSDRELDFQKEIDSVFEAVNKSMSTYRPDSDISRINNGDSTVRIDQMFRDVFELSKEINKITNGYFDPTVGGLVNAWGFGPGEEIRMDSLKVDSLLKLVGFDKVSVTENNRIKKRYPNIYFDFNAIAKGYAIDRLALFLDQKGIQDYLVEVGGEVVAKGENRIKEKEWAVGIEDPQVLDSRKLKKIISLKDRALASSGNYRKYRIDPKTGKKYVHTINPKTGYTKNSNVLGASVVASTCATADAYATAFMAMDLDESIKLLVQNKDLEAYIIYLDEEGAIHEFITDGFRNLIVE